MRHSDGHVLIGHVRHSDGHVLIRPVSKHGNKGEAQQLQGGSNMQDELRGVTPAIDAKER